MNRQSYMYKAIGSIMGKKKWTFEKLREEVLKFKTKGEFKALSSKVA